MRDDIKRMLDELDDKKLRRLWLFVLGLTGRL